MYTHVVVVISVCFPRDAEEILNGTMEISERLLCEIKALIADCGKFWYLDLDLPECRFQSYRMGSRPSLPHTLEV